MKLKHRLPAWGVFLLLSLGLSAALAGECDRWRSEHPHWVFCDDFESGRALTADGRFFDHDADGGEFVPVAGVGLGGSTAMRARFQKGETDAGDLKLTFGKVPSGYMANGISPDRKFDRIYYRLYLKLQDGWRGNPEKLSRLTVLAAEDWSQAMIVHNWGQWSPVLGLDPVRCVDRRGRVRCSGYNDFSRMDWIGWQRGRTPIFSPEAVGRWRCIEVHVKLNEPGKRNGVMEFWIDGRFEAGSHDLDFVGTYTDFGINAVFFENYWNSGSPVEQERYMDNIVVSTRRIGCLKPPAEVP